MKDKRTREAMLLYEIFKKNPRLLETKPEDLISKIEQFKRGLPLEDEFISLALWLGNCSLIHKLDQNQMPRWARDHFQVVDLFAVFKQEGRLLPVLVEVKRKQDTKLVFTENYYQRVQAYARLNKLPVLVAVKFVKYGLWILVPLDRFQKKRKAYHLDIREASKENLLCMLLGDFSIHFRPGIKFILELEKDRSTSRKEQERKKADMLPVRVKKAKFLNYQGQEVNGPILLLYPMMRSGLNERIESTNDHFLFIYEFPQGLEPIMILASNMHGMAMVGIAEEDFAPKVDWDKAVFNEEYKFTSKSLREAVQKGKRLGIVHMTGRIVPKTVPDFLR